MVARQKRKKSCVKKSRVVSAVPGSDKVVVFCVHGCGISYTTVTMAVDKKVWHKTLRKLNAHESQRCPRNDSCQRCPRKHARVRVSSTANNPAKMSTPSALALKQSCPSAAAVATGHNNSAALEPVSTLVVAAAPIHNSAFPLGALLPLGAAAAAAAIANDDDFWGCDLENLGATLEARELEERLTEDSLVLRNPAAEAQLVTGVYWTQPTENRHDATHEYSAEVDRRLAEPFLEEEARRRKTHEFVRRVFPEFEAKLARMRERHNRSAFWMGQDHELGSSINLGATASPNSFTDGSVDTSAAEVPNALEHESVTARRKRTAPLSPSPLVVRHAAAVSSVSSVVPVTAVKKRQRSSPAPSSPGFSGGSFGQIDQPDVLTLKAMSWGLGQQVAVHSKRHGGRREGHVVGIGGYAGSSLLLQFFAADGSLQQQLHDVAGAKDGKYTRGCHFDETTKISDFTVQQVPSPCPVSVDTGASGGGRGRTSSDYAGTAGAKIAPLQCDDLLMSLDDTDVDDCFGDLLEGLDSPFVGFGDVSDLKHLQQTHPIYSSHPDHKSRSLPSSPGALGVFRALDACDDLACLTDDADDDEYDDDGAASWAFSEALRVASGTADNRYGNITADTADNNSNTLTHGAVGRRRTKRPSITELLNLELESERACGSSLATSHTPVDAESVQQLARLFGGTTITTDVNLSLSAANLFLESEGM